MLQVSNPTPSDPAKKPDPAAKPSADDGLAGEGPDKLDHLDPTRKQKDHLESAIRGMRDAQLKLEATDAGRPTVDLQQKVIDDLDKLIEAIQQQNSSSSSSSSSSSRAMKHMREQQRKAQQKKKPAGGASEPKPAGAKTQDQAGKEGQDKPEPQDSDEQARQARRKQEEEERRRKLSQDIWGHLPPNVRDALLNVYNERFLPKYEDVVRKYYDSLAERNKQRGATQPNE